MIDVQSVPRSATSQHATAGMDRQMTGSNLFPVCIVATLASRAAFLIELPALLNTIFVPARPKNRRSYWHGSVLIQGIKKDVNPSGCTPRNHDNGKCSIWSKRSSGICPVRIFSAIRQQAVRYRLCAVLRDIPSFPAIFSHDSRRFPEIGWTRM